MKLRKFSVFHENLIFSVILFSITGVVLQYNLRLSNGENISFQDMETAVATMAKPAVDFVEIQTEDTVISVFAETVLSRILQKDSACDTEQSLSEPSTDTASAVLPANGSRYTRVYPIGEPIVKEA